MSTRASETIAPTVIERLAAEWFAVRDCPDAGEDDVQNSACYREYRRLQNAVTAERPTTHRDLALQYLVTTDLLESDPPEDFEASMTALADLDGLARQISERQS